MYSVELDQLLKAGFSKKFGSYYAQLAAQEHHIPCYDQEYVSWAHAHGFLAESAYAYGLNDGNWQCYLSDYDYYRIWPLNNWTKLWIDDKLTLKYMLAGTMFDSFMPKYYYYNTKSGLKKCCDAPNQSTNPTADEFIRTLTECGEFACKPNNGTTSIGFFRAYMDGDAVVLNGKRVPIFQVGEALKSFSNYIFTEYIRPCKEFSKYYPAIHTLRLVTVNEHGNTPRIIGGYLRIPSRLSGDANFIVLSNHTDQYNVFVELNVETGKYGNAKLTFVNGVKNTRVHPDSNIEISGVVPNYAELKQTVLGIARRFSTVEYMGFDIGVTEKGFRCMEINSHPGIKYMQIFHSLYEDPETAAYFRKKIAEIDAMSDAEREMRIGLQ